MNRCTCGPGTRTVKHFNTCGQYMKDNALGTLPVEIGLSLLQPYWEKKSMGRYSINIQNKCDAYYMRRVQKMSVRQIVEHFGVKESQIYMWLNQVDWHLRYVPIHRTMKYGKAILKAVQ